VENPPGPGWSCPEASPLAAAFGCLISDARDAAFAEAVQVEVAGLLGEFHVGAPAVEHEHGADCLVYVGATALASAYRSFRGSEGTANATRAQADRSKYRKAVSGEDVRAPPLEIHHGALSHL
jgi:hypothetical protein